MLKDGLKLGIHGISDVGRSREHNEDAIGWDADMALVLLADGMGGHNAGEVASEMAVHTIIDALSDVLTPEVLEANVIDSESAVREAVVFANEEIHSQSQSRLEYAGMGTTIVLTLFHEDKVTYANVGDSRIYRVRGGELQRITSDHSLVQEMVDNGYLSEEEALVSTSRNLITRALGIAPEVEVDVKTDLFDADDIFLLCSDGLSDLVAEPVILQTILDDSPDLDKAAERLVAIANENGGTDNISVVLVGLHEAYSDERGLPPGASQEIENDDQDQVDEQSDANEDQ
jgi:protein phosphatase